MPTIVGARGIADVKQGILKTRDVGLDHSDRQSYRLFRENSTLREADGRARALAANHQFQRGGRGPAQDHREKEEEQARCNHLEEKRRKRKKEKKGDEGGVTAKEERSGPDSCCSLINGYNSWKTRQTRV